MAFRIWRAKWDRRRLRGLAVPELTQRACNSGLAASTGTAWTETNCTETKTVLLSIRDRNLFCEGVEGWINPPNQLRPHK